MRRTVLAMIAFATAPAVVAARGTTSDSTRSRTTADTTATGRDTTPRMGATSRTSGMGRSRQGRTSVSRAQVRELQTALNNAGYDVGTPDGVMGPRTRQAMAQARQDLNVSGADVRALVTALNAQQGGASRSGEAAAREGGATGRARNDAGSARTRDSLGTRGDSTATTSPATPPPSTTSPISPTSPTPAAPMPTTRPATPPTSASPTTPPAVSPSPSTSSPTPTRPPR